MEERNSSPVLVWIVFLLAVVIVLQIVILTRGRTQSGGMRYGFAAHENSREIYVFDRKTADVYVTSPETVGDYSGEMWAKLNPTKKGVSLPLNRFLNDTSGRKLRSEFLRKARQAESAKTN